MTEPTDYDARHSLSERYVYVRGMTERLCDPLEAEDYQLQSMPDCSPTKWHLAHTTWFFETFVLREYEAGFRPFHASFSYLFNSYYDAVGERWPRAARGLLSRPTVAEVYDYRRAIDVRLAALLNALDETRHAAVAPFVELGLHHEQQHQELLLTDLKHAFGLNPLRPVYAESTGTHSVTSKSAPLRWQFFPSGLRCIGRAGEGFDFDNERPRHKVFLEGFRMASRPVTAGEYLSFVRDGGYDRPEMWLSDGWAVRQRLGWACPLYWEMSPAGWAAFTLHGMKPLDPNEAVCHVGYYEADAYARWAGARLPTEAEWEVAAESLPPDAARDNVGTFHPGADAGGGQYYGHAWQWTASPYTPYPGYRPAPGAVGEYNGKFMCNQMVLRGSSCLTPAGHARPTYRNFFPPEARWQFSGFRLAKDSSE